MVLTGLHLGGGGGGGGKNRAITEHICQHVSFEFGTRVYDSCYLH